MPAPSFADLEELSDFLNSRLACAVIWKPERLSGHDAPPGPVELLVEKAAPAAALLGARRAFSRPSTPLYHLRLGGRSLSLLLREPGDGLFCRAWQERILKGRVLRENGLHAPPPREYFYLAAYRLAAQRVRIRSEELAYARSLYRALPGVSQEDELLHELFAFMRENNYHPTRPADRSVSLNPRLPAIMRAYDRLEREPGLSEPALLTTNMHAWPNVVYFKTRYKGAACFVKYFARCDESPQLEADWTRRLHARLPGNFPEVLFCLDEADCHCIGMRFIAGQPLRQALRDNADKNALLEQLLRIARALRQEQCMHRDIWFDNFMVEQGRLILIDFQYAVGWSPYEEKPACLKYPYRIRALGTDNAAPTLTFDDMADCLRMVGDMGAHAVRPQLHAEVLEYFRQRLGRPRLRFPRRGLTLCVIFLRKVFCALLPRKSWRWRCRGW